MDIAEKDNLIKELIKKTYSIFENYKSNFRTEIHLDTKSITTAISDSVTDFTRAGEYHSETGADNLRTGAYIAKWIDIHRPVIVSNHRGGINLWKEQEGVPAQLNAKFCVFFLDHIIEGTSEIEKRSLELNKELALDLYYCFQFRYRMEPESIYLLLKHGCKNN